MALPPRIPRTVSKPVRKKREGMDADHLKWLRNLECPIYPGLRPIEAHHLLRADETRGMGRKAADKYAIPLSAKAHRELHAHGDEEAYLASKGVDGRALAASLYRVSGDTEAGLRLVYRARKVAA